jgi:hypothetical protein
MSRISVRIVLVALVLLAGCRDAKREAAVSDFARVYVQLRIASSGMEGQPDMARESRERVLRAAGMDLVAYRKRLKDLQADPDQWVAFWDRVRFLADSLERKPKTKGI